MPNAFLKEEVTELLMTWLIPHQQIRPESANSTERRIFLRNRRALFLAFAVDPVVNVVSRTAAVTAVERIRLFVKLG